VIGEIPSFRIAAGVTVGDLPDVVCSPEEEAVVAKCPR